MTVENAVSGLSIASQGLAEAASALRITVCEDAPDRQRTMHVDELCDAVLEFAATARVMAGSTADLDENELAADAPRVVGAANARQLQASHLYHDRIAAHERIGELRRLARRRGGWEGWVAATERAIGDCRTPLRDVDQALLRSWTELVQRAEIRLGSATVGRLSVLERDDRPATELTAIPRDT